MTRISFKINRKTRVFAALGLFALGMLVILAVKYLTKYSSSAPSAVAALSVIAGNDIASGTAATTISSTPNTTLTLPVPGVLSALAPQNIGHSVGIAGGGGLSKISTSTLNAELDQMESMGTKWVRFDIEWGDVQYSSPDKSDWSSYDRLVAAIDAHHMRALGVILFTPQWARASSCTGGVECPPADPATFATFAAQVAARYKSQGLHYWEIWNEPNNFNFWATKTDCAAYTTLLKAVYPAVKAADPNAVIVTGGLSPQSTNDVNISPTDFLSCVYANGGKNYFDAVGDHPYIFPNSPASDTAGAWAQMSLTSSSLRSIMIANGDASKKIWLTEFGAPTNGPDPHWYVSEAAQAQDAATAIELYKSFSWTGPIFWYTLRDGGTTTDTNENFFGLTRADGSPKPAYAMLKSLIAAGL